MGTLLGVSERRSSPAPARRRSTSCTTACTAGSAAAGTWAASPSRRSIRCSTCTTATAIGCGRCGRWTDMPTSTRWPAAIRNITGTIRCTRGWARWRGYSTNYAFPPIVMPDFSALGVITPGRRARSPRARLQLRRAGGRGHRARSDRQHDGTDARSDDVARAGRHQMGGRQARRLGVPARLRSRVRRGRSVRRERREDVPIARRRTSSRPCSPAIPTG